MSVAESQLRADFFKFLFGDEQGYVCIATQTLTKNAFDQKFFSWPIEQDKMEKHINRVKTNKHVWFCVNLLSDENRKKEYCLPTNLLWADLDHCDPKVLVPTPQVLIESSPDRYQAIWRMDEIVDPYIAEDYSKRIAYSFKDNGVDPSGWDLTQLLRVPFTKNLKYTNQPVVKLVSAHEDLLPTEIFDAFAEVSLEGEEELDAAMPKLEDMPSSDSILYKFSIPLRRTAFAHLWDMQPTKEDDWSALLWRMLHVCFEVGMSAEEVYTLAARSTINKYERDKRPAKYLWRDVLKAEAKQRRIDAFVSSTKKFDMPELIPGENYDKLPKGFVDDYRAWANQATDAVGVYHDLSAFILLSAIVAGNLKLETSYGKMVPNLWGLILGDSTLTRKSTAMRMATDFIAAIDRDILLATDGSAEGILTGLQARSNRTSMFFKDEVTGLFESMQKKDYLAGMKEMFTQLYDVPEFFQRRLRKETIEVTNPVFIFFGGGIKDRLYSLVDDSMVLSGFLPRFLIVAGDTDLTTLRRTGPATVDTREAKTEIFTALDGLYRNYAIDHEVEFLGQRTLRPREVEAFLTPDAWELYGDIEMKMVETAAQSSYSVVALPTFERLTRSMLKMSMLLASARQTPTDDAEIWVEADDVKGAAKYVQQWGHFTIDMLGNLNRSVTTHNLQKVLATIDENPGINRGNVMRLHNLTRREMNDIQDTLEDRGEISVSKAGRSVKLNAI